MRYQPWDEAQRLTSGRWPVCDPPARVFVR